jgi:hypothetical protein
VEYLIHSYSSTTDSPHLLLRYFTTEFVASRLKAVSFKLHLEIHKRMYTPYNFNKSIVAFEVNCVVLTCRINGDVLRAEEISMIHRLRTGLDWTSRGSCEHGTVPSESIKFSVVLVWLRDW